MTATLNNKSSIMMMMSNNNNNIETNINNININNNMDSTTTTSSLNNNINKSEEFDEMNLNLLNFLEKFNPILLNQLYESSMSCLIVFRELPSMAQNFVLRMLFIEQPIPQAVVQSWVKSINDYNESADILTRLQIWKSTPMQSGLPGRLLNLIFQKSFQKAYLGGGNSRSIFTPLGPDKHKPDLETLDNYAINKRWDSILNFMAGVKLLDYNDNIGEITKKVIFHAGLIENDSKNPNEIIITASGFQFLLMDISLQIWFFLRKYLELIEQQFGLNFIECLSFLFELNFLTLGKSYSTQGLNETLQSFLQHLREMGLVYQRKRKDGRFYPTRLIYRLFDSVRNNFETITNMQKTLTITKQPNPQSSSQSSQQQDNKREGFIVVETNYRVYAYTESPLQIALLTLFIELNYRFPKFIVGLITRDSVRAAFKNGITAKQITHYLSMHAHPYMKRLDKRDNTIIPSTIIDQIFLWEQERNRLKYSDGVLYSQFNSQTDYEALKKYANSLGVILFENNSKRYLVVTPSGHEEVRRFWKKYKKERD